MILITGATGNIGSEVLAALLPTHAGQIRALTRNQPGVVGWVGACVPHMVSVIGGSGCGAWCRGG
jgi:uncharacterized protein YbjT (DUF2867 family)